MSKGDGTKRIPPRKSRLSGHLWGPVSDRAPRAAATPSGTAILSESQSDPVRDRPRDGAQDASRGGTAVLPDARPTDRAARGAAQRGAESGANGTMFLPETAHHTGSGTAILPEQPRRARASAPADPYARSRDESRYLAPGADPTELVRPPNSQLDPTTFIPSIVAIDLDHARPVHVTPLAPSALDPDATAPLAPDESPTIMLPPREDER